MNDHTTPDTSCPQCRGETDPHKLLTTTLCPTHLAEAEATAPSAQEVRRVFEEGQQDRSATLRASHMPGHYRALEPRCPTCGTTLEAVHYDAALLRCPKCTSRAAPPPYVASLVERTDGSILCTWSSHFNGWVLPYAVCANDETIDQTQARSLEEAPELRALGRTLVYEATSDRGTYFFVYRVGVPDSQLTSHRDLGWLTRADIVRRSPLASFYKNLFIHVPGSEPGPSYDAALDLASRWLESRGAPNPEAAASLAAIVRQFATEHAAFAEETHRVDMIVKLERIGALQRQCRQLEQSLQHSSEPIAALGRRIDAIEHDRGRSDERTDVLRFLTATAEQYTIDDWKDLADVCTRLAHRILHNAHRRT